MANVSLQEQHYMGRPESLVPCGHFHSAGRLGKNGWLGAKSPHRSRELHRKKNVRRSRAIRSRHIASHGCNEKFVGEQGRGTSRGTIGHNSATPYTRAKSKRD